MTIEDAQQLQDWGPRYVGLGTWKGLVAACKTPPPPPPPQILTLIISQIQLRCSALPKGKSMVCLDSLLLYVYVSVFVLFKELVHNQS